MTFSRNRPQRLSLRLRSMLLTLGVLLLMLALSGAILLYVARSAVEEEVSAGVGLAGLLVDGTLHAADPRGLLPVRDVLQGLQSLRHVDVMLDSRPAKLMHISNKQHAPQWFSRLLRPKNSVPTYRLPIQLGKNVDYVTIRPDPDDEIEEVWKDFKLLTSLAAFSILLTGVLMYLAIWRGLLPLKTLQGAFARIKDGNFNTRINTSAPQELSTLQESFNHMAEVLESNIAERRRLAMRVVSLQEQDWSGVAREVHDELAPQLFRLRAQTAVLSDMLMNSDDRSMRNVAGSISEAVENLQLHTQNLYKRLRPQALDELGLEGAIRDLVNSWRRTHPSVEWSLELEALPEDTSDTVNVTVYRIIQECLTNAARHSGADRIKTAVSYEANASMIVLSVSDNGHGIKQEVGSSSFGLMGMRERLSILGGSLEYKGSADGGLTLHARVPVITDQIDGELNHESIYGTQSFNH